MITAVGAVVFLFLMDSLYRYQEKQAEAAMVEEREEAQPLGYIDMNKEGEEPNLAA